MSIDWEAVKRRLAKGDDAERIMRQASVITPPSRDGRDSRSPTELADYLGIDETVILLAMENDRDMQG